MPPQPSREGIEATAVDGHCAVAEPRVKPTRFECSGFDSSVCPDPKEFGMRYQRLMARAALGIVTTAGTLGLLAVPAAAQNGHGNGAASSHASQGNSGTSGDVNSPQPRSNADNNGHGANVTGPYDSTRNGAPSGNGNGKGNATGKPCAGCVGKADNKNPPGQMPGPQDHNNGYECDGNNGIAKTNPAHTGCKTSTSTPPPCDAAKEDCTPGCD